MVTRRKSVVFVWDNFGPGHVDRCEAVAAHLGPAFAVHGIELASKSLTYAWTAPDEQGFVKPTLFPGRSLEGISVWKRAAALLRACLRHGRADFFFCHYEDPAILCVAAALRLARRRVYVMDCSKFDDYERVLWREVVKYFFHLPYHGGITSGIRSRDYKRFLGVPASRLATNYNVISVARVRQMAAAPAAPAGTPHADRHFTVVARLVPKKNLFVALSAYAEYARSTPCPRPLHLCGSGPLEARLRQHARNQDVDRLVTFHGFLQAEGICRILANSLALLLPSIEEQFGNVVIEAQAMGVPVILSDSCGARDQLIRTGVNGFVIEPDNPRGLAFFMRLLATDEELWTRMAEAAETFVGRGDTPDFARAVASLIDANPVLDASAQSVPGGDCSTEFGR